MIIKYTIIVFITQFLFVAMRTLNIKLIASGNVVGTVLTGVLLHSAWLFSVGIGVVSVMEIVQHWDLKYLPVIIASTVGGAVGNYVGLLKKKDGTRKQD